MNSDFDADDMTQYTMSADTMPADMAFAGQKRPRKVMIDAWVWEAICDHYAGLQNPTDDDRAVQHYIAAKLRRQIAHDAYAAGRRIDRLTQTTDYNTPA